MQRHYDIYQKDAPPPLARRRRHARHHRDDRGSATQFGIQQHRLADAPTRSAAGRGGSEPGDAETHLPSRRARRRRRVRQNQFSRQANRVLWIVLGIAMAFYLVLLLVFALRKDEAPPAHTTVQAPEPLAAATRTAFLDIPAFVAERRSDEQTMERARRLVELGNRQQASALLDTLAESNPSYAEALMLRASLSAQEKDFAKASLLLSDLLRAQPSRQDARRLLASIAEADGNFQAAIALSEWVIEQDPYAVDAFNTLGQAWLNLNQPNQALSPLRNALNNDPGNILAQNNLAEAYTRLGEFGKAVELYRSLMARENTDSLIYLNLALCYAGMNQPEESVQTLAKASELFGASAVRMWLQSERFDSLRSHPNYERLETRLKNPSTSQPLDIPRPLDTNPAIPLTQPTPPILPEAPRDL